MALRKSQIYLLSFSSAIIAANAYYAQPLLSYWAKSFNVSEANAGQVFFYSILGQALGMIILIPFGDKLKRKKMILWSIGTITVMVILAAFSESICMLKTYLLIAGFFSIGPQLMIPMAVDITPKRERTHIVGLITAGVLSGVVAGRLLGGFITAWYNWRLVYEISAFFLTISFIAIYRFIPESKPKFEGHYSDILHSTWKLFCRFGEIRVAITVSGIGFVVSRMFWVTIAFLLGSVSFNLDTDIIGLFGLVTLAGAASASLTGMLNKRFTSNQIMQSGMITLMISFILLFFFHSNLLFIILGGILMEGSRQLIQITMQAQTISLEAEANSRLNTLFISGCFIGAALGAALGLIAWHLDNWEGVCYTAFLVLAIQIAIFILTRNKSKKPATADEKLLV